MTNAGLPAFVTSEATEIFTLNCKKFAMHNWCNHGKT
jgi:hypothetical protein